MGRAIYNDGKPLIKNNNAILAFDAKQAHLEEESPCINCGRCIRACPTNLMPTLMNRAYYNNDWEEMKRLNVMACIGCGCCSYVCPSKRMLNIVHSLGKSKIKEMEAAEKNGRL